MSDSHRQSEQSGAKRMFHRHLGYIIGLTKVLVAAVFSIIVTLLVIGLTEGLVAAQFGDTAGTYYLYGLIIVDLYLIKLYHAHVFY